MNDPITLAATEYEDPRGLPDTTEIWPPPVASTETAENAETAEKTDAHDSAPPLEADPGPGADADPGIPTAPQDGAGATRVRTLLETAATGRPVSEVTALVGLLKDSGQQPNPGHAALRAAAVARPVHEVREMVDLLGEPPHATGEADITLKAAALGRPIEDVALLVSILGTGEQAPYRRAESQPGGPGRTAVHLAPAPVPVPPRVPDRPRPPTRAVGGVLGRVLRWPVALALLVCGALHVPADPAGLFSGDTGGLLALAVTLLCLTSGALLAIRDTAWAWRAGAVVALGVTALHVIGGAVEFDPLAGAVGASVSWAGVTAVLSAATGAVLAGLALQHRPSAGPADGA
ncbi:hypothetical protein [Streptomyces sp. NBC_00503]|uniref:hypothetical protein n=1 Tax=Streptomyces sp. NBC_00503 TaxID=2903659 RepID=UPI002E81CF71|nr:hypothetical protein [Streptomyces sp. NBC_00503]WUD85128.1 hypothetical protein OG490_33745 [Streptomyces sp. NBC_00503]